MVDSALVLELFEDEEIAKEYKKRDLKTLNDFSDEDIQEEYEHRYLENNSSDILRHLNDDEIEEEYERRFRVQNMDASFLFRNKMFEDLLITLERNYPEFDGITRYKIVEK